MRKLFFVFVALLWVVAGVRLTNSLNGKDEGQMVQAFNKTNCMNATSKIQVSGPLMAGYKTVTEQRKILEDLAAGLGITGKYTIEEQRDGVQTTLLFQKEAADAKTEMKVVTVEEEVSDHVVESIQYLVVEIILYDKLECAVFYKDHLEELVGEYGITQDVRLQFAGELSGNLQGDERDALVEQLLENISARIKSQREEGDTYTVYAYTDQIEHYQFVNGNRVNVSVTASYNEKTNQTELRLATPFLNEDY